MRISGLLPLARSHNIDTAPRYSTLFSCALSLPADGRVPSFAGFAHPPTLRLGSEARQQADDLSTPVISARGDAPAWFDALRADTPGTLDPDRLQ